MAKGAVQPRVPDAPSLRRPQHERRTDEVGTLKDETKDEEKFKAYWIKELDVTEKETYVKAESKKDREANIVSLEVLLTNIAKEIADANIQIAETQIVVKKASQARDGKNAEFQQVVADQRATQAILDKALLRLKDFYVKGMGKAVLAQQEPPVKFNAYKDSAGSSPVMGMLEQIIEDSKALEAEALCDETLVHYIFVKDSNALIADLSTSVTSKTKHFAPPLARHSPGRGGLRQHRKFND
mmetsp:Transcript_44412/g.117399  ORF Transcript_44412/g.117399 Transcript_44412/m.117399 type:complete len:241 (+) Transcript_44412:53-775(+)